MCSTTNTWTRPGPVAVSQVAHLPDPCHHAVVPAAPDSNSAGISRPREVNILVVPSLHLPRLLQQPWLLEASGGPSSFPPEDTMRVVPSCLRVLPPHLGQHPHCLSEGLRHHLGRGLAPPLLAGQDLPPLPLVHDCSPRSQHRPERPLHVRKCFWKDGGLLRPLGSRAESYRGEGQEHPRPEKKTHGARRVQRPLPPLARAQDKGAGTEEAGWGV